MKYKVYALCEPGTEEVRYVGITKQTLKARLNSHVGEARREIGTSHRERWVRKLLAQGLKPAVMLLEETNDPEREGYWITTCREIGFQLVNGLALCEGLNEHDEEARRKIAEASRRMWADPEKKAEIGRKITEANTGRKLSPEQCQKIGDSKRGKKYNLGRKWSDETRRKFSESRLGKPGKKKTPEQAAKHKEMCAKRSADPSYRVKLSEARKKWCADPIKAAEHKVACQERSERPEYREKLKEAWKSRPRPTHCKLGHSLEDAYIKESGGRKCKQCAKRRSSEQYQRRKQKQS